MVQRYSSVIATGGKHFDADGGSAILQLIGFDVVFLSDSCRT